MPLPSLLNGAKQCQVMTRRTKERCKNLAAFGCKACRMHGAHKSRNVLQGENHPQYRNGNRTKAAEAEHGLTSTILLTLRDIGDSIGMFQGDHTRGRKTKGYRKFDMNDPEQLVSAILAISRERENKD